MAHLSIIDFPSGRWGFVGAVPTLLAYPGATAADCEAISHSGPRIARLIAQREGRELKEATYATQAEARAALCAYFGKPNLAALPNANNAD